MVRLAYAHNLKLRTFARLLFPEQGEVWYRDIDRLAPEWLVEKIAAKTGLSVAKVMATTLRYYQGRLFREYRESSVLPWILPLKVSEWKRKGYGLQFCPACLAEDAVPYFRKRWRVAFYTWCPRHNAMLYDRCPNCGASIAFHRRDLNADSIDSVGSIAQCWQCDFDLRQAPLTAPVLYEPTSSKAFEVALLRLDHRGRCIRPRGVRYYNVLHQLCHLMLAHYRNVRLAQFVLDATGTPEIRLASGSVFEVQSVAVRHHLVQLGFWYLAALESRLTAAWNAGAITHSALIRDFDDRPKKFNEIIAHFTDWRKRSP
jgi:hypothetical protein